MHLIIDEISNFFAAVLNIYPEIPKELHEEIKTMQAFLRSYDQKQLFLIQNFVRRLQQKAQKTKHQYKKKKNDLKTQPSLLDSDNKQNIYNTINTYRPGSIQIPTYENPFKLQLKEKNNQAQEKPSETHIGAEIKRYRMLFNNYSSGSIDNSNNIRALSMPREKTPSPLQIISSHQVPRLNSSPYLEASEYQFENINSSGSCIEPNFHSIQIRQTVKQERTQGLDTLKYSIQELKEQMEMNPDIRVLENCLYETEQ